MSNMRCYGEGPQDGWYEYDKPLLTELRFEVPVPLPLIDVWHFKWSTQCTEKDSERKDFFFSPSAKEPCFMTTHTKKHIPGVLDFRIQSRWACDGHIYVTISFSLEFRISSTSFSTCFHLLPFAMNSQSRSSYPHAVEKNHPRHSPGSLWGGALHVLGI